MTKEERPPPKCFECLDTFETDLFFLKLLNNPSRLYRSAVVSHEPCPYCIPESDDSSSYTF